MDAERRRKRDAILQILFEEAGNGRCYTANQFAESFEGKAGLGGERTIRERVSALSTQGYIKYFRNAATTVCPPAAAPSSAISASKAWCCACQLAMSTRPPASADA